MQEALPYRSYRPSQITFLAGKTSKTEESGGKLSEMVSRNAVVVVGPKDCSMIHVVNSLLLGHGVSPVTFEIDSEIDGKNLQMPLVFIGGKLAGGVEWVMRAHISGELVPVLKKAGALWL